LGAPCATTVGGKAALPGAPTDLGLIGMMAGPLTRSIAEQADVVLVVGAALDHYNSDGARLAAGSTLVRIDRRPASELWDPPARSVVHLTGDAGSLTRALRTAMGPAPAQPDRASLTARLAEESRRVHALAEVEPADGPNPWRVMATLDDLLPDDAYVVVGIGHFWYFVAPYLGAARDRRFHFGSGFALIGQALPLAVGAAVALSEPASTQRPVIAIEGDGSLPMNIQELQTAVRAGIDLLVIVLDNRSYGSEFHKLLLAGLDPATSNLDSFPMDFVAVATAMGATARGADDVEALGRALGELLPLPGVRLIDATIARSVMSEAYERQHGRH
jgi:acetolactate synthase I/II/III large subunit